MMIFKKGDGVAFPPSVERNAETLKNLNKAIDGLNGLDASAWRDGGCLNVGPYISEKIDALGITPHKWAGALEILRALAFGDSVDWDSAQCELEWEAREQAKPEAAE